MKAGLSNGEADRFHKQENNRYTQAQEAAQALPHLRQVHGGLTLSPDDVRKVLGAPYKPLALAALSYVNLTDRECNLLVLRHMRGHTQEETAEEMGYTVRAVQSWEKTALDKCAAAWKNLIFVQELLKAVQ